MKWFSWFMLALGLVIGTLIWIIVEQTREIARKDVIIVAEEKAIQALLSERDSAQKLIKESEILIKMQGDWMVTAMKKEVEHTKILDRQVKVIDTQDEWLMDIFEGRTNR
jgi:hypothetical protein